MSIIDVDRLVSMANQIGDFFAPYAEDRAVEGVRNHLRNYWDPRMREALLAHLDATGGHEVLPNVRRAADLIRAETAARTSDRAAYAGPPKP